MLNITRLLFVAGAAVAMTYTSAKALPADRTITYEIHETPTDPESPVVFIVDLDISAVVASAEEDSIGWDITLVTLTDPDSGGDTVWSKANPSLSTPGGLWWVDHGDITKPSQDEFVLPPSLIGTADPDDPQDDDLDYDLVGVPYDPSPGQPPYEVTAGLDFSFTLAQQQEPLEEGEKEPVEVPPGESNPD